MTKDPWEDLVPPSGVDTINARRVDPELAWGFFWARAVDGHCLLVLNHSVDSSPAGRLPRIKGIDVTESEVDARGNRMLVLRLQDSSHRDIFHRLCMDIMVNTARAGSEREAVEVTVSRTWRWHHLLRGGADDRLTPEEQKGLIGEMLVLERVLLGTLSAADAVRSWSGPLNAPKDFEIGRIGIEVKARRGAATPFISISSENQLDDSGVDELFLFVVDLDRAPSTVGDAFTVTDVARRIFETIQSADSGAGDGFETLLSAAGFSWEDDYSDYRWVEGGSRHFRVSAGFPRITPGMLESGVSGVKYSIALHECEPFAIEVAEILDALKGGPREV